MSATWILVGSMLLLFGAYHSWGSFVARRLNVNPRNPVPSHTQRDGIDYEPAPAPMVLGHHFASIAGAGPIVGPIIAAAFGWLPALLWILIGSVFLGAVHDFTSLVASLRHQGKSVGELIEEYVGRRGKTLFLVFALATLILVIAVFTDAVVSTFVAEPQVASSSFFFIMAAVLFGLMTRRSTMSMSLATVLGLTLLIAAIIAGFVFPFELSPLSFGGITLSTRVLWVSVLMIYVTIAAVSPVWVLLQPRDYLNSFLLYAMMIAAILGIIVAAPAMKGDAFVAFEVEGVGRMFPLLFVTVACGAISGFHSLVASGTTSKQLDSEGDAKFVGYGAMLIEAVLAVIALISVATLSQGDYMAVRGNPIHAFATSIGTMMTHIGLPYELGGPFIALTVSAFALTTLDTCTRLGRFLLQELLEGTPIERSPARIVVTNRWVTTVIVAAAGGLFAFSGTSSELWPVFGSANQLLAALALLAVATWLAKKHVKNRFVVLPMLFMYSVTVVALAELIYSNTLRPVSGKPNWLLAGVSLSLLLLSLELLRSALTVLRREPNAAPAANSL